MRVHVPVKRTITELLRKASTDEGPYIIDYIAANNMALAFNSYGKDGFHFQHLCVLALVNNELAPVEKFIRFRFTFLYLTIIIHCTPPP